MRLIVGFTLCALGLACTAPIAGSAPTRGEAMNPLRARGVVFDDRNRNGVRDPRERGVAEVAVSNGIDVTRTDEAGRYELPVGDDTVLFVVKPRDWTTPLDENRLPRFHYVHKPKGSPAGLAFPGSAPTGALPSSVDFPLYRRPEPERFRAIVLADTQPHSIEEIDLLAHDVVEPLIGTDALFGLTLGDLVDNDLSLFEPLNRTLAQIGLPWYSALGNHDINFRAADDAHANETFERVFGPADYAFTVARVHFIVLDDVVYEGWNTEKGEPRGYVGGFHDEQLAFVRNYLAVVPKDDLVVLAMHIPLLAPPPYLGARTLEVAQRRALLEILSSHPRSISLSGHTHFQYHRFLGPEEGFTPSQPHHHLNLAAASGSWWRGALDEVGIPHATMRDGAPNGYTLLHFDGNSYRSEFRAARRPADYQMNVIVPNAVTAERAGETEVLVNVFAGSERSVVEMRLGSSRPWQPLARVERQDPLYEEALAREAQAGGTRPKLPAGIPSPHLWAGTLPSDPRRGSAVLEVRARDVYGEVHRAHRVIRVE